MKILILSPDTRKHTGIGHATFQLCRVLKKEFVNCEITLVSDTYDESAFGIEVEKIQLDFIKKHFPYYNAADPCTFRGKKIFNEVNRKIKFLEYDRIFAICLQTWCCDILRFCAPEVLEKTILYSHGTALNVNLDCFSYIKNIRWQLYVNHLKKVLRKVNKLVVLDAHGIGNRYLDLKYAKNNNLSIYQLPNIGQNKVKVHRKDYLLSVSGFNKTKNPKFLIASIPKDFPAKLLIIGAEQNRYYHQCKRLIEKRDLDNVKLIVGLSAREVHDYYKGAALNLVTSITECQPFSIIDGQSLGIPYVGLALDSLKTIKGGKLTSKAEYWSVVNDLLNNNEVYDKLRRQAIANYESKHSEDRYTENLRMIMDEKTLL